jgi:cell division transport system ATP-binding protein
MALLERINQGGTTILMATHDASIVNQMQRRVIELSGGTVLRDEQAGGYQTQALPIQRGGVSNTTGIQTIPGLIR